MSQKNIAYLKTNIRINMNIVFKSLNLKFLKKEKKKRKRKVLYLKIKAQPKLEFNK